MSLQQAEVKDVSKPRSRVVEHILEDTTITTDQRRTLVMIYRSFQASNDRR